MRRADRKRVWERAGVEWGGDAALSRLQIAPQGGFEEAGLELCGGVLVLCGQNGSGKSRMLRSLAAGAGGEATNVQLVVSVDGGDVPLGQAGLSVDVIDSGALCYLQQTSLASDANLGDRIEQVDAAPLPQRDLGLVRYLLGRDYDNVEILEIEANADKLPSLELLRARHGTPAPEEEFLPYFRVRYGGVEYSSLELSLGELAGLTLFWALRRSPKGALLLIEEPDTFLSPLSAGRSLDIVAQFATRNGSPCVVTSHSHVGLSRVPPQHLAVLHSSAQGTRLSNGYRPNLWRSLRVAPPKRVLLVVEDIAAQEWLRSILARMELVWLDEVEVVRAADGAGGVIQASRFPDCEPHVLTVVGVLDGDARGGGGTERCVFLPGAEPPESIVLRALAALGEDHEVLGRSKQQVSSALAETEGDDIHDRVANVATRLGLGVETLRSFALDLWMDDAEAAAYIADLETQLLEITVPEEGET